jgi:hypothetical protein
MNLSKFAIAAATLTLTATLSLSAQESNSGINERKTDQQQRIANGVKSGQLTAGETQHLEKQESAINHEEHAMRQQDNGHLTTQDRKTIQQQQNQESRRIYRDKHNNKVR